VTLESKIVNGADAITGSVFDGTVLNTIIAGKAVLVSHQPAPQAGNTRS